MSIASVFLIGLGVGILVWRSVVVERVRVAHVRLTEKIKKTDALLESCNRLSADLKLREANCIRREGNCAEREAQCARREADALALQNGKEHLEQSIATFLHSLNDTLHAHGIAMPDLPPGLSRFLG